MENKKIILGFVGLLAAGKGTTVKYLKEKHGASPYRFSTMLRDVLKRLYIPDARENMQFISTALRQYFGEDIIAKVMASDVANDKNKIVAVDGVRRLVDIKYLAEMGNFKLVRIAADPKIRYQRIVLRKENPDDADKTFEQFLEDHNKEADAEIPMVMAKADLEINNNGSLEDLYKQIDQIILNS
ncbi:MAG: AAA family ATPase [Patescibacteria group bacterium]|jgi:dephospho-CoA kinase